MTFSTNMGGNSVYTNTKGIKFADGTEQDTAFNEPTSGRQLFVDGSRTDTYVPDGTYLRPFPTIMGAVDQIIANGDNSGMVAYTVVIAPGVYNETVDLSNPKIVSLGFEGQVSGQNSGVVIGTNGLATSSVQAINNDNLLSVVFVNIRFASGVPTHGIQFSSTTNGTNLGAYGIVFRNCGLQFATSDCYFNNVSFVLFDDVGVTPNVNITNVNLCEFTNSQGPDPGSTISVNTAAAPTPAGWAGHTNTSFNGCGSAGGGAALGNITCDAGSSVQMVGCVMSGVLTTAATTNATVVGMSSLVGNIIVSAGGTLGIVNSLVSQPPSPATSTVTVDGILLSVLSTISNTAITVNNGGIFVEEGGLHDDEATDSQFRWSMGRTIEHGDGHTGSSQPSPSGRRSQRRGRTDYDK